jgi:cell wall assembly regulator SMI1
VKAKSKNARQSSLNLNDEALRRLVKAPETALKIYELAESLYMRDGDGSSGAATGQRMSLADIEQVQEYLRQAENDIAAMKKQFLDLATLEGVFQAEKIPVGF